MTYRSPDSAGSRRRPPSPDTSWWTNALQGQTQAGATARARTPSGARAAMTRRSWYLARDVCDDFTACVAEIRARTGMPKHDIVAALLRAAVSQAESVVEQFKHLPPPD